MFFGSPANPLMRLGQMANGLNASTGNAQGAGIFPQMPQGQNMGQMQMPGAQAPGMQQTQMPKPTHAMVNGQRADITPFLRPQSDQRQFTNAAGKPLSDDMNQLYNGMFDRIGAKF